MRAGNGRPHRLAGDPGPSGRAFPGRAGSSADPRPDLSFPARHFACRCPVGSRNPSCIQEKAMPQIYRRTLCAMLALVIVYVALNA